MSGPFAGVVGAVVPATAAKKQVKASVFKKPVTSVSKKNAKNMLVW